MWSLFRKSNDLLRRLYVISTEAMRSIVKWRNLLRPASTPPPCFLAKARTGAALGMTPTMSSTEQNFKRFMLGAAAGFLIGYGSASAKADFVIGTPKPVPNVNSSVEGDCDSSISADGLELYFRRDTPGWNWNIWVAKRQSVFHPWEEPKDLGPPVNVPYHTEGPSISADGLELYFSSSRPGALGWTGVDTDYDIWVSKRETKQSPWQEPVNLGAHVNSAFWEVVPSISADGLELYFEIDAPGKSADILVSKRETKNSPWQEPVSLDSIVNKRGYDGHPSISKDGLCLYFSSSNPSKQYGSRDIFVSTRPTINSPWQEPVNLGPMINSPNTESGPNISFDNSTLYFDVFPKYGGGYHGSEIWQASITPVVDFNNDGLVDLKDLSELEQNLFQDDSRFDIFPVPFGDGKVDANDLDVFLDYMFKEPGLMAYWELDESEGGIAHDFISDCNGVLYGNPVWRPDVGLNGALELNGDDYVDVPYIWNPSDGGFSAFAWVKGGGPGQSIISQKSDDLMQGATWLGVSLEGKLMTELASWGRAGGPLVSDYAITDGNWHNVGFIWDGNHRYLYLDNVEVAKDTRDVYLFEYPYTGLYFGAGKALEQGSFWNGLIDDIKIYNRALGKEKKQELPADSLEDFETQDFSKFDWKNWGAGWFITSEEKYSGNYSARALAQVHNTAILWVGLDCVEGDITFYHKVPSGSSTSLRFYIDNIEKGRWLGIEDWTKETFHVEAGRKYFMWKYGKGPTEDFEKNDTACIDDIVFPVR